MSCKNAGSFSVTTASVSHNQSYRPDIDGLRAVAVLAVILFHLNKALVPGGFVGVDIFFVISGFLISKNILLDLESGHFSIVDFYRRRIKRIAPPLLVVVAVTLVVAQMILLPEDAERAAKSAIWSLASLANVYFWRYQDTSYFAAPSSETPLLHLWSLGVEEQFYLLWPIALLLFFRKRFFGLVFALVVLGAAVSFFLAERLYAWDASFVYYMLPTRAGELLIGAMVALFTLSNRVIPKSIVHPLAISGLVLLGSSLFLLSENVVFPGWLALPPTLGAACLIVSGQSGQLWSTRFLTIRPVVWIGLVSYSAYLWHWPLLAFYRYGHTEIALVPGVCLLALTFLLAWASYLYIERPARRSNATALRVFSNQYLIPAGILGLIAMLSAKLDGYGFRWFSENYKTGLVTLRDQTKPAYEYDYVCQRQKISEQVVNDPHCVMGSGISGQPHVLLWGDSNAAHYVGMLAVLAKASGFKFRNLELGSCPPIFGDPNEFVEARRREDCRAASEAAPEIVSHYSVIIISASWSEYEKISSRFLANFFETAKSLAQQDKLLVLIGKIPPIPGYDRLCREKALSYPWLQCPDVEGIESGDVARVNRAIADFAAKTPNVKYFDPTPYLCFHGHCPAFDAEGNPTYYDSEHLNLPASWRLGNRILLSDGVPDVFRIVGQRAQY